MTTIDVDRKELVRLMKLCFRFDVKFTAAVRYLLGAKAKMGAIPGVSFTKVDCSGFVRWLINGATHGEVTMPDGSWRQQHWCQDEHFKRTDYSNAALLDNRLRIAFINAGDGKVGHVWLIINGMTIESYGGHGTGRRKWNTPVLLKNVNATYVLTDQLQ